MASLGSLFVQFEADTTKWSAGVNQILRDTKELEKQINSTIKLFTGIGGILAAAGTAIVGTMTAAAKAAANYGDAIRDASIRTGLSTEALSGFKFAAEQTGTSFEELQVGLKKFAVATNAAAQGTKAQIALFQQFGIAVKNSSGQIRPIEELLGDVADRFRQMPDGVQKASAAVAFFGKSGVQLTEFLSQGKEGLSALTKEAERLGLVIGNDAAKQADNFNDSLNEMENATKGLEIVIGNVLLPRLTDLALTITDIIARFTQFAKANAGIIEFVFKLGAVLGTGGALFLGLAGLLALLPKLALAWNALTLAMAANPIGFIAVAAVTATVALIAFRKEITEGLAAAFDKLAKIGVGIPGLVSPARLKEWSAALRESKTAVDDYGPSFEQMLMGHKAFLPATNDAAEAQKKLLEAFNKSLKPADDLGVTLKALRDAHVKDTDILIVHGEAILKAADAQRKNGIAVNGTTAELEKQILVLKGYEAEFILAANAARTFAAALPTEIPILQPGQIPELPKLPAVGLKVEMPKIDAGPVVEWSAKAKDAEDQAAALSEKIRQLSAAGITAKQIMMSYGNDIEDAAKAAKIFGIQLPENIKQLDKMNQSIIRQQEETKKWEQVWSHAMGQIVADFAKGVADIIFKGGSLVKKLKDIGLQAGRSFTEAFLLQLFSPFEKFMADLGKKLADVLTDVLDKTLGNVIDKIAGSFADKLGVTLADKIPGISNMPTSVPGGGSIPTGGGGGGFGGMPTSFDPITAGVSAAGSIGVIMQLKRIEGTMNAVEYNTRASRIHLEVIIDQLLWPMKFATENLYTINYYSQFIAEKLIDIGDVLWHTWDLIGTGLIPAVERMGAGAARIIPKAQMGGYVSQEGLVYAHAGESIVPHSWSQEMSNNVNVDIGGIHIEANGADMANPDEFAQKVMKRLDREIMTGNRGYTGKWSKRFSQNRGNVTTSPVRGG